MGRPKIPAKHKAISKPISLYPAQALWARQRALAHGGVSKYFQRLVEYDRAHNVLGAGGGHV